MNKTMSAIFWFALLAICGSFACAVPTEKGAAPTEQKPGYPSPDYPLVAVSSEERERFYHELPRLKDIQSRWEDRILRLPGMVSMGIGRQRGKPVFIVSILEGYPTGKVPREIEGTKVILQARGPVRLLDGNSFNLDGIPNCNNGKGPPCHANQTQRPVEMGNSARWFQLTGGCTMGFKACDLGTGRTVFVTNSHCAQFPSGCAFAPVGDNVLHAANGDGDPGIPNFVIGQISGHAGPSCATQNNFTDATKVNSPFFLTSHRHRDIGAPNGTLLNPTPNDVIQLSGRSSGHNVGGIVEVHVTVNVPANAGYCCGPLVMKDQIAFDPPTTTIDGDSGSGVLTIDLGDKNMDRKLVGLLWGTDNVLAYVNRLDRVLSALNLTADLSRCLTP